MDDLQSLLPPLLRSLDALVFIARHLNPPDFAAVMAAAGTPDHGLGSVRARLEAWPEALADVRDRLAVARTGLRNLGASGLPLRYARQRPHRSPAGWRRAQAGTWSVPDREP